MAKAESHRVSFEEGKQHISGIEGKIVIADSRKRKENRQIHTYT